MSVFEKKYNLRVAKCCGNCDHFDDERGVACLPPSYRCAHIESDMPDNTAYPEYVCDKWEGEETPMYEEEEV